MRDQTEDKITAMAAKDKRIEAMLETKLIYADYIKEAEIEKQYWKGRLRDIQKEIKELRGESNEEENKR